jgi:hypothetical protein
LPAALLLVPAIARADETASARALYDQGSAAYNAGDFARAAALLADADAAAPNPMVLGLAIGASLDAGDAVLGEDLALRADARGATGDLSDAASRAHARFQAKVGRVRIVCAEGDGCAARLGSMRWNGGEVHAVAPGIVDVVFDEETSHLRIAVGAGKVVDLVQPAPARPVPTRALAASPLPPPPVVASPVEGAVRHEGGGRGLSPAWFWVGVAVTAGGGIVVGASGADTTSLHGAFLTKPTVATQNAGESAQLRTNVVLGATIASAVVTATLGVFFTRWRAAPTSASALSGCIVF